MSVLMMVMSRVRDAERFQAYVDAVQPILASYGAVLRARESNPLVLEGEFAWQSVGVLTFPSAERAAEMWASPEYEKVRTLRESIADFDVWVVPLIDPAESVDL